MSIQLRLLNSLAQRFHYQQFIPPVIYHLYSNLSMFACLKRSADRTSKVVPDAFLMCGLQSTFQVVPSACARKECLADVEAEAVIICIKEPCRHIVALAVIHIHGDRIEDIEPDKFDLILGFLI